jgi:hypothetical protein
MPIKTFLNFQEEPNKPRAIFDISAAAEATDVPSTELTGDGQLRYRSDPSGN